mmetsp:Transcript_42694/g.110004  ORF Transcript_42694/g.110004 Transcript_42694/m.110004 type:complete len:192 (-) Transcript_42694:1965-2540(-)|eukprot:CAMPEP_0113881822 /NCGR_PEP_ID=MMETSP0780_2-20120614/8595_1 /TAXON_ID=652834 /ORGANISM="Palpitomonas bilix" /LENGTH=191 /DNA_ID=CAMNT_0000868733 /DNA_START=343 /DNA_END=918 /DNA_ORIENTATION=- /assembly_acc=CAM_ASM_000599
MEYEIIKCAVVGDRGIGKSALIAAYADNIAPSRPRSIRAVSGTDFIFEEVNGEKVQLQLHDVPGDLIEDEESCNVFVTMVCNTMDVIIFAFSLTSPSSLANVNKWLRAIPKARKKVLVGTKSDLVKDATEKVESADGLEVSQKIGAIAYFECTANNRDSVQGMFQELIKMCRASTLDASTVPQRHAKCTIM